MTKSPSRIPREGFFVPNLTLPTLVVLCRYIEREEI